MITADELADAIGRKKIAEAFGVGMTAVSNAVVRERFPSSWFVQMSEFARQVDMPCPPELFGMKLAALEPSEPADRFRGAAE